MKHAILPAQFTATFLHKWDFWMLELRDRWMAFRTDVTLFCAIVKVTVVTYIDKSVSAT
jgi:hypothetical protein